MALLLSNAPMPSGDRIAKGARPQYERAERPDPDEGKITDSYQEWLTRVTDTVNRGAVRINSVELFGLVASIAPTDFSGGSLSEGLYRITYYAKPTRAAGVSSSLALAFSWTDLGVAVSKTFPANAANDVTVPDSEGLLIRIDGESPITYATTYATLGAPTMVYELQVVLELVKVSA